MKKPPGRRVITPFLPSPWFSQDHKNRHKILMYLGKYFKLFPGCTLGKKPIMKLDQVPISDTFVSTLPYVSMELLQTLEGSELCSSVLKLFGLASSPYVTSTVSQSVSPSVSLSDEVLILPTIRFF